MTGTICYEVSSGLGIQCKSFVDHGIIDKVYVWPHSTYKQENFYTPEQRAETMDELLRTCDTLFFFETPFRWDIIARARQRGIKTILMAMYECTRYPFPYTPDVLIGGSEIEVSHYKKVGYPQGCTHINAPVDMKWKLRKTAKTFIHNAGHGGIMGRNGTKELLAAMEYVSSPIKLIVRAQNGGLKSDDQRVHIINHSVPYEELWKTGDVMILPEKFGGSFLPMQEAFASGMAVMATDRFPTNTWLPQELLIKPKGYIEEEIWHTNIDVAVLEPQNIAQKIDEWYGKDITRFSEMGREWGKANSWEALKPKYESL